MKYDERGLTLTEVLVGLIIGSIVLLSIGVMSSTAIGSYERLRKESEVYADISYGFNLIKYAARNSSTANATNTTLTCGNRTFQTQGNDFVYQDSNGTHPIITGVSTPLDFKIYCSQDAGGNWELDKCSSSSTIFHVTLSGKKDKVAFNLYTDVMRRN